MLDLPAAFELHHQCSLNCRSRYSGNEYRDRIGPVQDRYRTDIIGIGDSTTTDLGLISVCLVTVAGAKQGLFQGPGYMYSVQAAIGVSMGSGEALAPSVPELHQAPVTDII